MKAELKVGLLAIGSLLLIILFAYMMGATNPFSSAKEIHVMYNFAGGIEQGSPVRVMGIKVGRVKSIQFDPHFKMSDGELVNLRITISVNKNAWATVRKDSKFFINLAGVIGEKFLEISPGTPEAGTFEAGDVVRGEDPPRVDQLISQSYGLAGKVIEILEKNEGSVSNTLNQLDKLLTNFNKTLVLLEKTSHNKDIARLVDNSVKVSDDLVHLTGGLRSKKAEESYQLIHKLLMRLEPLDAAAIKKFMQEEGVKARIF